MLGQLAFGLGGGGGGALRYRGTGGGGGGGGGAHPLYVFRRRRGLYQDLRMSAIL